MVKIQADEYFQRMKETNDIVNPFIRDAVFPLKQYSKGLFETVYELPEKRIEASGQARVFFLRSAYECVGCPEWEKIAPICAAVELELCSGYYSNRIYDEKGGEKDLAKISKGIIASKITKDLSAKLILEQKNNFSLEVLIKISDLINESDLICEIGQYLDIFENIYKKMQGASFDRMVGSCIRRIYLVNASYYEKIGTIAGLLAGSSEDEIAALAEFGRFYGISQQIVNDIADFVPSYEGQTTSEKEADDCYRDIMHGKLTLPVIHSLHHGTPEQIKRLKWVFENGMETLETELFQITKDMLSNGSIDFAMDEAKKYGREAKKQLRIFQKNKRGFLSAMAIQCETNRYYHILNSYKNEK